MESGNRIRRLSYCAHATLALDSLRPVILKEIGSISAAQSSQLSEYWNCVHAMGHLTLLTSTPGAQAPAHRDQLAPALTIEPDHIDIRRRRDVVVRAQIARRPEHFPVSEAFAMTVARPVRITRQMLFDTVAKFPVRVKLDQG